MHQCRLTTTATDHCAGTVPFTGFLDATIWTIRGIVPFSGGGKGIDHVPLDLANPIPALETPAFLGAPGNVSPDDGVMNPANGTTSGEVSYGSSAFASRSTRTGPAAHLRSSPPSTASSASAAIS